MEGKAWQSSSSSSPMMTHEERRIQHNLYCQKLRNFCRSIESHQRLLKEFSRRSLKTRRDSQHSASVSPASRRFYDTRAASSSSRPRRPYSNVGSAAVARDGKKGLLGSYDGSQNGVQGFRCEGTVPPATPLNPSLRCELSDTSNTARAQHLFYGEQVQPGDQRVNSAGANINNIKHNYRSEPGGDWDRNTADLDRESHRTASTSAHTDGTHNAPAEGGVAKYTEFTGNALSSVVCSKVTKMKCRDSLSENTHRSRDSNSIGTSGELNINMSTHGNEVHLHDVAKNKRIISMNGRNKGRRNLTSDEGKSKTVSSSQNRQQNIHGDTNVKLGGKCARLINLSSPEAQTALLEAKQDMDVGCTLHDMEGSGSSTSRGHDATTAKSKRPPENEDHSDSIEYRLATKTKHISLGRRESQNIKPATEVLKTVHNQNQHHASPYTVKTLKSTNSRSPRFGNESVRPITRSTKLPQIHNSWLQSSQESFDHQRNKNRFPANGKNSMPWLLGEREQTFEITPLGYDSRFVDMEWKSHYSDNLEHPNSEIVSRSVAKCMDWLNKCTSSG